MSSFTLSFVFFFSSRRRHTRWPRDWSSDVCSSDLEQGYRAGYEARGREDEVFAQAVADRLFVNEIRVGDRRKFVKWLIESGKAQEARRTHYERFDKGKGPG